MCLQDQGCIAASIDRKGVNDLTDGDRKSFVLQTPFPTTKKLVFSCYWACSCTWPDTLHVKKGHNIGT